MLALPEYTDVRRFEIACVSAMAASRARERAFELDVRADEVESIGTKIDESEVVSQAEEAVPDEDEGDCITGSLLSRSTISSTSIYAHAESNIGAVTEAGVELEANTKTKPTSIIDNPTRVHFDEFVEIIEIPSCKDRTHPDFDFFQSWKRSRKIAEVKAKAEAKMQRRAVRKLLKADFPLIEDPREATVAVLSPRRRRRMLKVSDI